MNIFHNLDSLHISFGVFYDFYAQNFPPNKKLPIEFSFSRMHTVISYEGSNTAKIYKILVFASNFEGGLVRREVGFWTCGV